jgi:bifunctional enzyme CysN/CysC
MIVAAAAPPPVADRFEATIVWMGEDALLPGRGYWLTLASQTATAIVQPPKYEISVNSREHLAARTLELNAIGVAEIGTDVPIVFEAFGDSRALGGFILVDKVSHATVACGMLHFALRRASNIHWQAIAIDRDAHARQKQQRAKVVWLTGWSAISPGSTARSKSRRTPTCGSTR